MPRSRDKEVEEKRRQERLAYVGALAAALVHEVRTPLHAIQLNAQMLSEDVDRLSPDLRHRFERRSRRIYTEVQALTKTLESFLTFARPPRPDPTPTDINLFLRDLVDFARPEMEEAGVEIVADLAPDMYPVVIDQNQFTHVILNLLRNAREAIEQRRERESQLIEGVIHIATEETVDHIHVLVEDNGIGIDPGDTERIFEVFYSTKEKGTGLGLGIVRRIVEDHRGSIEVLHGSGTGACFQIVLPRGHFLEFKEDSTA